MDITAMVKDAVDKITKDGDLTKAFQKDPAATVKKVAGDKVPAEAVDKIIQDHHLMPSVVADTINEAFFDEIGDMVVESDDTLTLIEDYREDVAALMGGNNR